MAKKEVKYYNGRAKKWNANLMENIDKTLDCKFTRYDIPSDKLIKYFIKTEWETKEELSEKALYNLFNVDYIDYNDKYQTYIKVTALNDTYSTRLSNDEKIVISEILCENEFADRLSNKKYDEKLVNEICDKINERIGKKTYSFISKYCSHINENEYPIFDGYVELMLKWYRQKDKKQAFDFNDAELTKRDYDTFRKIMFEFKEKFEISKSLKEIDEFLWTAGKKYFPTYVDEKIIP